jgi:hypothetical protein
VKVVRSLGPTACTAAPSIGPPVAASVTVPASVPTGPRGEASTAANASSRPSPQTLLSSAVPPQLRSSVSIAVSSSSCRVRAMSPTRLGAADHINATVPATCGEATEVPLNAS